MAIAEAIVIIQGVTAAAELITALDEAFDKDEPGEPREMNGRLSQVLAEVNSLKRFIGAATREILEEIREVHDQIDEDVALDQVTLANSAIQRLLVNNDKDNALDASFRAADRLFPETSVLFTTAFSYVVDIRTLVVKDKEPCYWGVEPFKSEMLRYLNKLDAWVGFLNDEISRAHTVTVSPSSHGGRPPERVWRGVHSRSGVVVATFESEFFNEKAKEDVRREANASRARGIAADRQRLGVVHMEQTAATLRKPFTSTQRRQTMARQLVPSRQAALAFDPEVSVMDDQVVNGYDDDVRTELLSVLCSPVFRDRVNRSFRAFCDGDDDRLVNLAHRRLFQRDATDEECGVLRAVAASYGYPAFVAALLYSDEYGARHGGSLPGHPRKPLMEHLDHEEPILLGNGRRT